MPFRTSHHQNDLDGTDSRLRAKRLKRKLEFAVWGSTGAHGNRDLDGSE